ncbi:MAG: hypothetical protein IJJ04_00665 [Clostridia bacterium]|nr:hypothetical protein [Clostridia bacterium]
MKENDTQRCVVTEDLSDNKVNTNLPEESSKENFPEDEDGDIRKPDQAENLESELVLDDEAEEYEEEATGIKIKYKLTGDEVKNFIKHSESYKRNKEAQKKHTIIQLVVFLAMIVLGFISGSKYYFWIAAFPLVALFFIWFVPVVSVKSIIKKILLEKEITVEIFPDKIEVCKDGTEREIPLDGTCECSEYDNLISISSLEGNSIIIPLRAIESDFRAEVQAMIMAGSKTKDEE